MLNHSLGDGPLVHLSNLLRLFQVVVTWERYSHRVPPLNLSLLNVFGLLSLMGQVLAVDARPSLYQSPLSTSTSPIHHS